MPKFKKRKLSEYITYIAVIVVGIILDQLTKWLAVKFIEPKGFDGIPIIEDALHLTYHTNPGAAWGMLADSRWVFMLVSSVLIVALSFYLIWGLAENMLYGVSISLIISGGIGNMIDRIFLGEVVDFIDFRLIDFPIFNGADSFVCVGAGLLILALVIDVIKEFKSPKDKNGDEHITEE